MGQQPSMWFPQEGLQRIWRHKVGRTILLVLLVLSPVVLTIGIRAKLSRFETANFSIETNREQCIRIARDFLAKRGVSAGQDGWKLEFQQNEDFFEYVHRSLGEGKDIPRFRRFPIAPAVIQVRNEGSGEDAASVVIGPSGAIVGYRLPSLSTANSARTEDRQLALASARQELDSLVSREDYTVSEERVYEQTDSRNRRLFRIEWTATRRDLPELSFTIRYGVSGSTVFSQRVEAEIAEGFREGTSLASTLHKTLTGFVPFYIVALIIYMLVRYIQRTLEKEVSHGRAIVVALYLLVIVGVVFLNSDQGILFNINVGERAPRAVYILVYFMVGLAALLAGASYSSCEGDIRESFKGSMTSFDALLTGRVFSSNVGRAFAVGFVAASWLFFLQVLAILAFEGGLEEPSSLVFVYRMAHAQIPAVMVFLLMPLGVGFVLLFGLLIPLSIVGRLRRIQGAGWAFLLVMVLVNLFLLHGGFVTLAGAAAILGTEAFFLLTLVRFFDLMTAYICRVLVSYLAVLTDVQMLTSMPEHLVLPMHGVVLVSLIVSLAMMRYGKEYKDEEVRPSYARALAERQSLSAQLSAAAVAQAQLSLTAVPEVEGLSIAAVCRPARVVSGDYFDCFLLGPRSVGVLMISGARRGLLDAMAIAFTKGFLLERVHASRSAHELLSDLLENLSTLLQTGDAFPELCFVFLDSAKGTASYSRTERFPGLVSIRKSESGDFAVREGAKAEMSSTRSMGERSLTLRHGTIPFAEQATLLAYSCGFERSLVRAGIGDFREWLRGEWMRFASTDAGSTLQKLANTAMGGAAGWQAQSGEEDRTLMVMNTVNASAKAVERAA